ncbi:hypothetical protein BBJ29_009819 [Phytophthora kernoviae]|uniref:DUF4246 domain-containing protein n=1 Tax=Phytophthora kernoviae TaxID=325452 RepID=A0A421FZR4_9STRA|nr:hypothetical protein BBJ29_009819 [Phytophthora kernoviae]
MDAESDEEGEYSGDERMDEGATEDSEDEIYAGSELSAEERTRLLRRDASVGEALPIPLGSELLNDDRLLKLKMHCKKIHRELDAAKNYIVMTLTLIANNEGLSLDMAPNEVVISPAGVDGVWLSDNLISDGIETKFQSEVALLENVPDDEKDCHPGSMKQVLDLVHPSLFCCVFGQTKRVSTALDPPAFTTPAEQMHRVMLAESELVEKPKSCNTAYQWIPTDFFVAEGGKPGCDGENAVRILSYINNLHPEQYSDLYDSIGRIFGQFVPLFERMLSDKAGGMLPSAFDADMYGHESWHELPRRPIIPEVVKMPKKQTTVSLRGRMVQVIVKIAEIVLTPDNSKYKGGSWHMEGTSAEKIVGTGIYYFDCENIKESFLCFRAEVDEPPYQQDDKDGVAAIYGLFDDALLVQDVGSVQSVESRCVAFPNSLQHQVRPFELKDPNKPGVRKILAFFLVDPETPIPSTSVIPPQQRKWIDTKLEFLAETLQLVDRVEQNIRSMLNSGMPLLEAKQNRLDLMEERAAAVEEADEQSSGSSRYFSLCEH